MDIWQWVHDVYYKLVDEDKHRLAELMDVLPSYTCGDEHEKVDQIYPEALNLARQEKNPWIEVFVRHWYLQSQILHRHNVKGMSNEAVDLLEFANRDETKDCPQSVCVVQDLTNCYAKRDGPAFVEERKAVSKETLSRITPAWPCYDCIGTEYLDALVDDKDYEFAMSELKSHREQRILHSGHSEKRIFALIESRILRETGHYKEAESVARSAENPGGGESFLKYQQAATALALAYQGRFEEAEKFDLDFNEIAMAHSHFKSWCELNYLKAKNNSQLNNANLNNQFNQIVDDFIKNGVERDTLQVLFWQSELAFIRKDSFSLQKSLEQMESIATELAKELDAGELLETVRRQGQELESELDKTSSEALTHLLRQLDEGAELSLTQLAQLHKQYPDNSLVLNCYFKTLSRYGYYKDAIKLARDRFDAEFYEAEFVSNVADLLLAEADYRTFDEIFSDQFLSKLGKESGEQAYWALARRYEQEDPEGSLGYLEKILSSEPEYHNTLVKAAALAEKTGDFKKSKDYWTRLILLDEENIHYHWDRMIPATAMADWESVRESCAALEIELANDSGEIAYNGGSIRIQLNDSSGEKITVLAKRIGPVLAKVIGIRNLDQEQVVGQTLTFYPAPLNKLDQEDDDGYKMDSDGYYTYLYSAVRVLEKPEYFIFAIDGIYPGHEQWNTLVDELQEKGAIVSIRSSDEYQLTPPDTEETVEAIYAFVACPPEANLTDMKEYLSSINKTLEHPLIWPRLCEVTKDLDLLKIQAEIEERYGIT